MCALGREMGVAYLQVADAYPPERKITLTLPGCSTIYIIYMGMLVGISTAVLSPSPFPLGCSMAFGASMPCGAGTSKFRHRFDSEIETVHPARIRDNAFA